MAVSNHDIDKQDILIVGHARAEDMILVTNNVRKFERMPELKIET